MESGYLFYQIYLFFQVKTVCRHHSFDFFIVNMTKLNTNPFQELGYLSGLKPCAEKLVGPFRTKRQISGFIGSWINILNLLNQTAAGYLTNKLHCPVKCTYYSFRVNTPLKPV